jgi:hypothetical protein
LGFEYHRRRNVFSPVDEETQEDNRQHDQYDENDESDQDLDQDNDGRNGFDDFNDHDSNDEGESHSPHRYASARFKDNDIYDEGESRPSRRYVSARSKQTDYRENVKLVSGLLQGLPSIPDPPTADSTRKYVEDHENAVSYDASYDGFLGHKTFHNMFKRGLGNGTSRKLYDEINRRPHIKELWDAAEAQDRAYMQDLTVSTPAGTPPIAPGNFATHYWPAFKAEFLGLERTPWYDTHYSKFSRKGQEQGKDTVSKYYETKFMSQVNKQLSTQEWPHSNTSWTTLDRIYTAHVFFANLDMHLKAKMMEDHPEVCLPAQMHRWKLQTLYETARSVEMSAVYQAEKMQRDEQLQLKKAVAAVRSAASINPVPVDKTRACHCGGSKAGTGTPIDKVDLNGTGYTKRNGISDMSDADWAAFDALKAASSKDSPVPGWEGLTYSKRGEVSTENKPGFTMDFCKSWRTGKGCGAWGHRTRSCKELLPDSPRRLDRDFTHDSKKIVAPVSETTSDDDRAQRDADLFDALCSIGDEIGGKAGDVLNDLRQKYSVQPVRSIVLAQTTHEHSLVITLDDGREYLIDTGSSYTIITNDEWKRLHAKGRASTKLPKADNINFVSASNHDLGYAYDTIVDMPVCQTTRPVRARICDGFAQGFPFLAGLDTITALGGEISTRRSDVAFLSSDDDDAVETRYPFRRMDLPDTIITPEQAGLSSSPPPHMSDMRDEQLQLKKAVVVVRPAASNKVPVANGHYPHTSDEADATAVATINNHSYSDNNTDTATLYHRGAGIYHDDGRASVKIDDSGTDPTARTKQTHLTNPVYRAADGDTLWDKLGLDHNDWAQLLPNCTKMEAALAAHGDVFRPNDDDSLRQIRYLDGIPIAIDIFLKKGVPWAPQETKACRVSHYTPSSVLADGGIGFSSRRLGTVTRGDGSSVRHGQHNRLYDPDYPMSTISEGDTYGGNRGSQWVCDALGPRQWTLPEECAIHYLDDKALGYIARSFPVAPLVSMYEQFEAAVRSDDDPNYSKQEGVPSSPSAGIPLTLSPRQCSSPCLASLRSDSSRCLTLLSRRSPSTDLCDVKHLSRCSTTGSSIIAPSSAPTTQSLTHCSSPTASSHVYCALSTTRLTTAILA